MGCEVQGAERWDVGIGLVMGFPACIRGSVHCVCNAALSGLPPIVCFCVCGCVFPQGIANVYSVGLCKPGLKPNI